VQQLGSSEQTVLQQGALLQPGVSCWIVQLPCVGSPHCTGGPDAQYNSVSNTHVLSQLVSQQDGSFAHTALQQAASEQPPLACAVVQEPLACAPQSPTHRLLVRSTHDWSQAVEQHSGTNPQTVEQHSESEHPPGPWITRQLSGLLPHDCAEALAESSRAATAVRLARIVFMDGQAAGSGGWAQQ
jgi:hypothetical protein